MCIFCSSFFEREDWFYTLNRAVTEHMRGSVTFSSCSGEVSKPCFQTGDSFRIVCVNTLLIFLQSCLTAPTTMRLIYLCVCVCQARDRLRLTLGEKAPTLVPVSQVMMCMNCTSDFSLTLRRHHCHGCGRVSHIQIKH